MGTKQGDLLTSTTRPEPGSVRKPGAMAQAPDRVHMRSGCERRVEEHPADPDKSQRLAPQASRGGAPYAACSAEVGNITDEVRAWAVQLCLLDKRPCWKAFGLSRLWTAGRPSSPLRIAALAHRGLSAGQLNSHLEKLHAGSRRHGFHLQRCPATAIDRSHLAVGAFETRHGSYL